MLLIGISNGFRLMSESGTALPPYPLFYSILNISAGFLRKIFLEPARLSSSLASKALLNGEIPF